MSRIRQLPALGITAIIIYLAIAAFLSLIDYYLDALTGQLLPGKPLPPLAERLVYFQDHPLTSEFARLPFATGIAATYFAIGFLILYSGLDKSTAARRVQYFEILVISITLLLAVGTITAILTPFVTGAGRLWLDDGPVLSDYEKTIRYSVLAYVIALVGVCVWRWRATTNRNS